MATLCSSENRFFITALSGPQFYIRDWGHFWGAGQTHGGGGGVYNLGTLTLSNCTIADNTSLDSTGGGLNLAGGLASIYNTIVSGNHNLIRADVAGSLDFNYATNQTQYTQSAPSSYDLISDGSGNLPFEMSGNPANHNLLGTSLTPVDPRLAPLGNYGGPTQTMALRPGSPAIDAGSNALAVGPDGKPLLTDQRGYYRIFNGTVDIGAYEYGSSPLLPGDADADGKVGFSDLVLVARHWGMTNAAWADGDFNNDGSVGFDDLLIVARNYGKSISLAASNAATFSASLVGVTSSPSPMGAAIDAANLPRHRRIADEIRLSSIIGHQNANHSPMPPNISQPRPYSTRRIGATCGGAWPGLSKYGRPLSRTIVRE